MRFCKPIKSFYQLPATVPIATKVKPIKKFYKAEKYHQDYIAKNPMDIVQITPQELSLLKKMQFQWLIIQI
jgi:peptide methionine sulfoxide reductase MsrA